MESQKGNKGKLKIVILKSQGEKRRLPYANFEYVVEGIFGTHLQSVRINYFNGHFLVYDWIYDRIVGVFDKVDVEKARKLGLKLIYKALKHEQTGHKLGKIYCGFG